MTQKPTDSLIAELSLRFYNQIGSPLGYYKNNLYQKFFRIVLYMNWMGMGLVIVSSCTATKNDLHSQMAPQYIELAADILGDSLQYTFNPDSTLVLCQKIAQEQDPPVPREVHYCVIDVTANQVIHQAHMANGSVAWHSREEIAVRNYKGYPTVNDEDLYLFNLKTGHKTPLYQPGDTEEK